MDGNPPGQSPPDRSDQKLSPRWRGALIPGLRSLRLGVVSYRRLSPPPPPVQTTADPEAQRPDEVPDELSQAVVTDSTNLAAPREKSFTVAKRSAAVSGLASNP